MKIRIMPVIAAIGLICLSSAAWCCAGGRLDQHRLLSWRPLAKAPLELEVAATGETKFIQAADGGDQVPGSQAQEEKRRVPKKDDEKKEDESEDEDDSGILGALSDCLNMLNFFSEVCGDDEEGEQAEIDEEPIIEGPEEWLFYEGVINPVDPMVEEVEIWSVAGGRGNGGNVVRLAPRGTRLRVMGKSYSLYDYWLYVGAAEQDEVYGWIREKHVAGSSEPGTEE